MLMNDSLCDRFAAITGALQAHASLWQPAPFCHPVLSWESQYPALAHALRALPDAEVTLLENDPAALQDWLAAFIPALRALPALVQIPAWPVQAPGYPPRFEHDIPGRKWQQVCAFTGAMDAAHGPVLEWCAGKGHLGRAVSHTFSTAVTGLEWNASLCDSGNALNEHLALPVQLACCDVLGAGTEPFLSAAHHAVALHACGDLHRHFLQCAAGHGLPLHLAPCCYHLGTAGNYTPLSAAGQACALALTREDLRLAVQETVTAPASVARQRHRKSAWRLGFDALQRQVRQQDTYLPVPSIPDVVFQDSFERFCHHAAALKGLTLPATTDWLAVEARGWQRHAEVSRLELPRHAFRRLLELWLVTDYALFLQEHGYRVQLGTFCDRSLTPRNLLLAAQPA